jgi:molybdopterin-guanine dinucleotide biosynthesis protein A
MIEPPATLGVILAGGLGRRLGGGDKGLRVVGGAAMAARVAARLRPQCAALLLNANGDPARFASFGLPVAPDTVGGFAGPLAGVLAALDWVAARDAGCAWVVSAPADCPFIPRDLVARLHAARTAAGAALAVAASGGRPHHAIGLWRVDLRDDLRRALTAEGLRKVAAWTARHGVATAVWPTTPDDPFFNVNTPADLAEAERLAASDDRASVRSLQHEAQRQGDEPERRHARGIESDEPDEPAHQ